jgi:hypothetical protein
MTTRHANLERAFAAAAELPESEQDALAAWILAELSTERRWRESLAASPADLADLAREAREEYRRGQSALGLTDSPRPTA